MRAWNRASTSARSFSRCKADAGAPPPLTIEILALTAPAGYSIMGGPPPADRPIDAAGREIGTNMHRLPRPLPAAAIPHGSARFGDTEGHLLRFLRAALPAAVLIASLIGTPARAVDAV